ncbi:semaphorin-4D [Pimephales promelas]|nr:semaphorin-4D [Pimephales promelas]
MAIGILRTPLAVPHPPVDVPSSGWRGVDGPRLIPPLLREQSWALHPHQAFLLFCLALGPRDVSVEWHMNGRTLKTPVFEHRRVVSHDAVLVSSWLKEEALTEDVQYECTAVSETGNDASKVDLRFNARDEAGGTPHMWISG